MATIEDVYSELWMTVSCTGKVFNVVPHVPRELGQVSIQVIQDIDGVACLHWYDQLTDSQREQNDLQCRILSFKNEEEFDQTPMSGRGFRSPSDVYEDLERFHCGWNVGRRNGIAAANEAVSAYMNRMEA